MIGLLDAAFGVLVAVLADVGASRLGLSRVAAYGSGLGFGFAATLAAILLVPSPAPLVTAGIAVLAYGAWWFILLNLVQALESSLRVRLLGEIRAAGGRLPRAALEDRYNDTVLLRLRLDRLVTHGSVVERDGRLHVRSGGLRLLAGFFRALKRALTGRTSEFGVPPS